MTTNPVWSAQQCRDYLAEQGCINPEDNLEGTWVYVLDDFLREKHRRFNNGQEVNTYLVRAEGPFSIDSDRWSGSVPIVGEVFYFAFSDDPESRKPIGSHFDNGTPRGLILEDTFTLCDSLSLE